MTLVELLREAHSTFSNLSIKIQPAHDDENEEWIGWMVEVTTPKGAYNGWAEGPRESCDALEEMAVKKALTRSGIGLQTPILMPEYTEEITEERVTTEFVQQDTEEQVQGDEHICEECGNRIEEHFAGSQVMSVEEVITKSKARYDRQLCSKCIVKSARKARVKKGE